MTYKQIYRVSKNKKMKAYKDKLTPEQIDGLVKYVRTLEAKP